MTLLEQLKRARVKLGLKQKDMMMRVGMSRQQYQHIESDGNPRLATLELLAKGLNCELMLIPKSKCLEVQQILDRDEALDQTSFNRQGDSDLQVNELADDPSKGLL